MGTEILCLQELNDVWQDEVDGMLPGWDRRSSPSMTISTYVKPGLHILSSAEVTIFPESIGKKNARKTLQVVVGRSCASAEQQQTWNVWNNHTVVGSQKISKVNGDVGTFCESALNRVVKLALDSMQALAPAQSNNKQCLVLLGDWNWFTKTTFGDALRKMPGLPDYHWHGADKRDFIVCFCGTQEVVMGQKVLAQDGAHCAITTKIGALAPAQGNPFKSADQDQAAALRALAQAEELQRAEAVKRAHTELEQDLREDAEEQEKELQEAKRKRIAEAEQQQLAEAQAKAAKADEEARLQVERRVAMELEWQAKLLQEEQARVLQKEKARVLQEARLQAQLSILQEEQRQREAHAKAEEEQRQREAHAKAEEEQRQARQREQEALDRASVLRGMLQDMIRKRKEEEASRREEEETERRLKAEQDELLLQRRATEEQEPKEEEEEQDFVMKLMPCKGLVMPIGHHVGEASTSLVVEALRQVLALRREKLEKLGQDADPRILPFTAQKEVHHCIYVFPTPASIALAPAQGNKSGLMTNAADLGDVGQRCTCDMAWFLLLLL